MPSSQLVNVLNEARLQAAKKSYTSRRVPIADMRTLIDGDVKPEPGDVVLARVERLGHHTKIELCGGRRAKMFVGDEIIACYGHRYASAQYEAVVGDDLSACDLVTSGGVVGTVRRSHSAARRPTRIVPIGLVARGDGAPLNLRDYALSPHRSDPAIPKLAVVGTSMSSGKTTIVANVVKGLVRAGYRVGAAKVTGTGSGRDLWYMKDAGADQVLDFVDAGYASTYQLGPQDIEGIFLSLVGNLAAGGAEVAVVEIADGLFQKETFALLGSPHLRRSVDGIVFAAGEAVSAIAGSRWLVDQSLPVMAVSGSFTSSPLAIREVAGWIDLPVIATDSFSDPDKATPLWADLLSDRSADALANVVGMPA